MQDPELLPLEPPARKDIRVLPDVEPAEWHALSWRPAGSMSLGDRWLRAGETRGSNVPPALKRRR